jgi:hypothetical protein
MSLMKRRVRYKLITAISLLISNYILAQSSQSPYSALGIGEIIQPSLISNIGMGGFSIAYPNSRHYNLMNPAFQGVKEAFTTFEAGYLGETRSITQYDLSQRNGSGNLLYLGICFPIKRGLWSSGFALVPYSYSNYNIITVGDIDGVENEEAVYNFRGEGGISNLFWSHGVKVTKNFSLGTKISYLFGSFDNETIIELDQPYSYNSALRESIRVRDFSIGFGAIYRIKTGANSSMYLGGIYDVQSNLNTTVFELLDRQQKGSGQVFSSDTVINDLKTDIVLPMKYGFGLSYVKGIKWLIGADFIAQQWESFKNAYGEINVLSNSYKVNMGFELIPDANSISSYLKRIIYRTGFYYEMTPYRVNNDQIYDFGINFGVSLPVAQASFVNLSLQYGQRDGHQVSSISENYFRLSLGLTVNDVWFYRRKID